MEAASLQCQPFEQPDFQSVSQPTGKRGTDVEGSLMPEKGLTTSSVAVSGSMLPHENGACELVVEPVNGSMTPKDASIGGEGPKSVQELEGGQALDNISPAERNSDGEGHALMNGGRQKRASALAATRKVSDYIVQESKSIRELRNDLQVEAAQGTKKQGKKRKASSPTTPLPAVPGQPPCTGKTSPTSSTAEACTQQLWEGSSDGEAGPLPAAPAEAPAAAPLENGLAEVAQADGHAEGAVEAPVAGDAPVVKITEVCEPVSEDALQEPHAGATLAQEDTEMVDVPTAGSTECADEQPAPQTAQAVADEEVQAEEGAMAVGEPSTEVAEPAAEDHQTDEEEGAEEAAEEDTEWPPKGSLAAEAALLLGRTQYVRKSALEARSKIAGPRLKRKYTRRKHLRQGSEDADGEGREPSPEEGGAGTVTPTGAAGDGNEKPASFFPSGKRRGRPPGSRNLRPRGRGRGRGRWGSSTRRSRTQDSVSDDAAELGGDPTLPAMSPTASYYKDQEMEMDTLYGCTKCRFAQGGCAACRDAPIMERPKSVRWKPEAARPQTSVPSAPTFYPTPEEFQDPVAYINKIRHEGEKAGIACIVPPEGWDPPFALEKGTNGQSAESFRFSIRKQLTSHLCMRVANTGKATKRAKSRYDRGEDDDAAHDHSEFGFVTLERPYTLRSFAAYADWVKALHFSDPPPKAYSEPQPSKRRKLCSYSGPEPTVEEIEGEFWRIVESPDEVVESLYGQDLDSGHHGSGFPLPPFRQRLLEAHLAATEGFKKDGEGRKFTPEETAYSEHKWNINNMPRCKGSVLRYLVGEELITGVMVPWLYVGSALSAFCWHVEDHALYSVNYLHMGAPKVWYGVPAHASEALETAMHDALPHLFEHTPDLLYQLVTLVSPTQLRARGVPVHRLVHKEGSFVITFPNAYHAGFNTGFNCAEAVNFGPPDWLPWGTYVADKYRREGRSATLSHDALLIALVTAAPDVSARLEREAKEAAAQRVSVKLTAAEEAGYVRLELHVPSEPAAVKTEDGDVEMEDGAEPQPLAATAGRDYVPGESTDLSFLDPINRADTPPRAIQLAAAELSLRIKENRRRLTAGLGDAVTTVRRCRMSGKVGATDEEGVHTNTEDVDCEVCKGDLHLWSVVSHKCPGRATCPEHASALGCPVDDMTLLYRFSLEEMEGFLEEAKRCIPGTSEVIDQALDHEAHKKHEPEVVKLGPISMGERLRIGGDYDSDEDADEASPTPTPPPPQPAKRPYKRKTAEPADGVVKPKRKYTRRSDKWKIKKAKSEDEDERTPDAEVNGGEAEGAAEAAGGDGLRRTRRPRAATRNIADLLADAEGTDEDEEPAEPELDSEQDTKRGPKRRGPPPGRRGGRRKSAPSAVPDSEEPLPIIEHDLVAAPLTNEVSRMAVPSVPVPVWPPVAPPPVVSPVAPTPVVTTGAQQPLLNGAPASAPAAPAATAQQMIPITMLAELQRVMAHNAAVASSAAGKPPASLPSFTPYDLFAHGAGGEQQNGSQGMLPLMQTLARLLPMAAYQAASQPQPAAMAVPAPHSAPAALQQPQEHARQHRPSLLDAHPAFAASALAALPQFSAPYPGLHQQQQPQQPQVASAPWPAGFPGTHHMFQPQAQQPAWPQQPVQTAQPLYQPAHAPPPIQTGAGETLAAAPAAAQGTAQPASQPSQPAAEPLQQAADAAEPAAEPAQHLSAIEAAVENALPTVGSEQMPLQQQLGPAGDQAPSHVV